MVAIPAAPAPATTTRMFEIFLPTTSMALKKAAQANDTKHVYVETWSQDGTSAPPNEADVNFYISVIG